MSRADNSLEQQLRDLADEQENSDLSAYLQHLANVARFHADCMAHAESVLNQILYSRRHSGNLLPPSDVVVERALKALRIAMKKKEGSG